MMVGGPFLSDPSGPSPLLAALAWVEGALLGSVATAVAVICIAVIGVMMFSGRIDVRRGVMVVLGCFVLFGAASIAGGFRDTADGLRAGAAMAMPPALPAELPPPLPSPAAYDPYSGASVIRR
jgi:type IV secretory pathway VirB2 component (pilin)